MNSLYFSPKIQRFLLSVLILALADITPVQASLTTMIETRIKSDKIQVKGPFSRAGDKLTIHPFALYEEDHEQVISGVPTMTGSVYLTWNDKVIFALASGFDDLSFLELGHDIPTYDYVRYRGTCLGESNKLMSFLFAGNYSGTVNASRPDDLFFVYFDTQKEAVEIKQVSEDYLAHHSCVDSVDNYVTFKAEAEAAEKTLISSLQPHEQDLDKYPQFLFKLRQDPHGAIQQHFKEFTKYYQSDHCQNNKDFPDPACLETNSTFTLIAKHPAYEIHRLAFIHDCASSGVDLLYIEEIDSWYHLHSIPAGCSKHFLFYPNYNSLAVDEVLLDLCPSCSHWGEWRSYALDLRQLRISATK